MLEASFHFDKNYQSIFLSTIKEIKISLFFIGSSFYMSSMPLACQTFGFTKTFENKL